MRQGRADAIDGLNDVGAGLPEHDHQHGGLAVEISRLAQIFYRIDRLTDIAHSHGHAVAVSNHQRLVINRFQELIVGAHLPHVGPVGEMPFRHIRIGASENASHRLEADAVFIQHTRIQFDADAGKRTASHGNLADTCDLRQLLRHDCRSRVIHLPFGEHFRSQPDNEDGRIRRIDLSVAGIGGQISRQVSPRRVDGRFHIARGRVDYRDSDRTEV